MASLWFTVEAGALIRGRIRREIEGAAWGAGLDVRTDESKSWGESVYRFTVSGEPRRVTSFVDSALKWIQECEVGG